MAAAIVVSPIPSAPLAFAGGLFFGPTLGTLYSVVGATVGAGAAFLIARGLGRSTARIAKARAETRIGAHEVWVTRGRIAGYCGLRGPAMEE